MTSLPSGHCSDPVLTVQAQVLLWLHGGAVDSAVVAVNQLGHSVEALGLNKGSIKIKK